MFQQVCTAIGPVAKDIGRICVARHLISQDDFDDLRDKETLGKRVLCDHLLAKLRENSHI